MVQIKGMNMSWDRKTSTKSYYYRSRRVDGQSVKEYVGRGPKGEQAAQIDAQTRLQRINDHQHWDAELHRIEAASEEITILIQVARILALAISISCDCYLHRGHEWRRRRDHD